MSQTPAETDYQFRVKDGLLGAQMMFVAFGALVLVPLLTGLNPNVALFTAGAGTLVFQLITGGKVPVFLASSFAFIAPIMYGVDKWGIPGTLCGLAAAGVLYMIISLLVKLFGSDFLHKLLPPVVVGPVIMVIGLILAPVAVNMALGLPANKPAPLVPLDKALILSIITLLTVVIVSLSGKGLLKLVPILCGIVVGYIASLIMGLVNFKAVADAAWISVPDFQLPVWNWDAVLYVVPVAIAPAIEHFGDVLAIGSVTGKDYVDSPGIHRTMLGDGVATSLASFLGGPPNTTYSEVTGAVALTKVFNPAIMTWASIFAIALAFVNKLGAILQTIPVPVMGGIMLLCFGAITVVGLNTLIRNKTDLMNPRNLVIVSLILVSGIGTAVFDGKDILSIKGIGLAGILGIALNLVLPKAKSE